MATGGVANVLYQGEQTSYFNQMFLIRCSAISVSGPLRHWMHVLPLQCCVIHLQHNNDILTVPVLPSTFVASITHPTESLFVPAWLISLGTILINITQYGTTVGKTGQWLLDTMFILFWIYCALAVIFSCGIYLVM